MDGCRDFCQIDTLTIKKWIAAVHVTQYLQAKVTAIIVLRNNQAPFKSKAYIDFLYEHSTFQVFPKITESA